MRFALIVNPASGRAGAAPDVSAFDRALSSIGVDLTVARTEARGDAIRIAAELAIQADVLGVIGGDGTVHETVNGLMQGAASPIPLVIVPYGAGNDLAHVIDCPKTPEELAAVLDSGVGAKIDVLDFGERLCVNSAGLGFEGQVNRFSQSITSVRGHVRYMVALAKALARFSFFHFKLTTAEGVTVEGDKLLISIGNGIRTGGAFYLTPDAWPDDGLLDACIVEPMGRVRMLRLLPKSFKGNHVASPDVTMLRTESLIIDSDTPYPMHIDGEFIESPAGRRTVTTRRHALRVLCKPGDNELLRNPLEKIL
ncbi:MAG: diacylglycerol kinase family lipid kinase [Candidatus Latescibacterota bacterium]|nr:MAG: diacylglycerol kinase family lipid kinase [Candidatus Latescibacterota bacterium]